MNDHDVLAAAPARERGVALMAVIVVLLALIVIATPFSISMQNQDRTAQLQSFQTKSEKSALAALTMAEEALTKTIELNDETPYVDTNQGLTVDQANQLRVMTRHTGVSTPGCWKLCLPTIDPTLDRSLLHDLLGANGRCLTELLVRIER